MAVAYPVDQRDSVVALAESTTPTAGAWEPTLLANEDTLRIAYYAYGGDDAVALVVFSGVKAHYGALSPLVIPSGVEESLKTCHWKHQEISGVRST